MKIHLTSDIFVGINIWCQQNSVYRVLTVIEGGGGDSDLSKASLEFVPLFLFPAFCHQLLIFILPVVPAFSIKYLRDVCHAFPLVREGSALEKSEMVRLIEQVCVCVFTCVCNVEVSDIIGMGPLGHISERRNIYSQARLVRVDMCFPTCHFNKSITGAGFWIVYFSTHSSTLFTCTYTD